MMSRAPHILTTFVLLMLLVNAPSQVIAQGDVVVHADPRLSVLIKKPHNVDAPPPAPVVHHKSVSKGTGSVLASNTSVKNEPAANKTVVTTPTTSTTNVAVQPLPGENGHAAGWTPPVHRKAKMVYSGKGFRVQIYNGPDRQKAILVKTEFMRAFPGVRTYLTYMSPSFRVKVGDYRNRSDAVGMWKEANSIYYPSMIVPDIVTISTF